MKQKKIVGLHNMLKKKNTGWVEWLSKLLLCGDEQFHLVYHITVILSYLLRAYLLKETKDY